VCSIHWSAFAVVNTRVCTQDSLLFHTVCVEHWSAITGTCECVRDPLRANLRIANLWTRSCRPFPSRRHALQHQPPLSPRCLLSPGPQDGVLHHGAVRRLAGPCVSAEPQPLVCQDRGWAHLAESRALALQARGADGALQASVHLPRAGGRPGAPQAYAPPSDFGWDRRAHLLTLRRMSRRLL
jgi:hypothetical protein